MKLKKEEDLLLGKVAPLHQLDDFALAEQAPITRNEIAEMIGTQNVRINSLTKDIDTLKEENVALKEEVSFLRPVADAIARRALLDKAREKLLIVYGRKFIPTTFNQDLEANREAAISRVYDSMLDRIAGRAFMRHTIVREILDRFPNGGVAPSFQAVQIAFGWEGSTPTMGQDCNISAHDVEVDRIRNAILDAPLKDRQNLEQLFRFSYDRDV